MCSIVVGGVDARLLTALRDVLSPVTVGRMFSDSFAGIAPGSAPGFIAAQIVGALIGLALIVALYPDAAHRADDVVVPHPHHSKLPSRRQGD